MKVFTVITGAAGTYDNYADGSHVEVSDGGIATVKPRSTDELGDVGTSRLSG